MFCASTDETVYNCMGTATRVATIVVDQLALHSLSVNLDIGKSEFLLDLAGPDSKTAYNKVHSYNSPYLEINMKVVKQIRKYKETRQHIRKCKKN